MLCEVIFIFTGTNFLIRLRLQMLTDHHDLLLKTIQELLADFQA